MRTFDNVGDGRSRTLIACYFNPAISHDELFRRGLKHLAATDKSFAQNDE